MKQKIIRLIFFSLCLLFPLIVDLFSTNLEHKETLCPFLRFFHIPCPGCGLTKSIINFYHGEIQISIAYHHLGFFFVILCLLIIISLLTDIIMNKNRAEKLLNNYIVWQIIGFIYAVNYAFKLWQHFAIYFFI